MHGKVIIRIFVIDFIYLQFAPAHNELIVPSAEIDFRHKRTDDTQSD